RNGSALRPIARRRLSACVADGASAASVSGRAAIAGSHWSRQAKSRIKPPPVIRQAMSVDETKTKADLDAVGAELAGAPGIVRSLAHVRTAAALLATFAVGLAGGYVAKWLHFPLPYMTGALLLTATLGLAGVPVRSVWQARAAGQFVTGTAIGTSFTPAVLLAILALLPMLVVGAVISIAIGAAGALILMRLVKVDSRTAFLAAMPGGVIEMANVAARVGADPLPIMVLQTMRVGLTVTVAPFLATVLAEHGTAQEVARAE